MIMYHGSPELFDRFASLTPERVAAALSTGQWYASRNCSYITTCCDELLDELGVRGIVEKPC